jgi:predicted ArsR family transcriptional regulator
MLESREGSGTAGSRCADPRSGPELDVVGVIGNNRVVKSGPVTGARRVPGTSTDLGTAAVPSAAATRVARALRDGGPQTAAAWAERLGLTGTAVRRQLDTLTAAGHVSTAHRPPYGPGAGALARRGRGRPARVYVLTLAGRDRFAQSYDELAVSALRYLAVRDGDEAVAEFARAQAADLLARHADVATSRDPASALADGLTSDGFAATVVPSALGTQICQHHCPIEHVAREFPQLCEAETDAFGRLLGTHVTRLATLAGGDGVCTTLVPSGDGGTSPRKDTP